MPERFGALVCGWEMFSAIDLWRIFRLRLRMG